MKHLYTFTITAIALMLLAACAGKNTAADNYPPSIGSQINEDIYKIRRSSDYILQPGDLLEIQVFMEPSMDRTLRISGNGTITYPLVGNINLKGISAAKAEEQLSASLKNYIKDPQVSILIKEYGNKTVYVLGQVKTPQSIELPPEKPLTVLEAISSAGGFTDIAGQAKVRVLRMENGQQQSLTIDVTQITKLGNKSLDIPLMPGDIIFVPQSMF